MKILITILFSLLAAAACGLIYVYAGAFDAAADQPHSALVYWLAETARERSIAARAKGIDVPNLEDPNFIAEGASEYSAMCAGCHLASGIDDNEMRRGLYPQPADLAEHEHTSADPTAAAARQFWIIKHGIKMSAMPAWGVTHDDATIWSIVAFVRKLPTLTPAQYAAMTRDAQSTHAQSRRRDICITSD